MSQPKKTYSKRVQSRKSTKERRKKMNCSTVVIKLDKSHFSKADKDYFQRLQLEAKWLTNQAIYFLKTKSKEEFRFKQLKNLNLFKKVKVATPIKFKQYGKKRVPIKFRTRVEELKVLSSQMKQAIGERIIGNILGLSTKKNKGQKVGGLKYVSSVNSIPLKQFDSTYYISHIPDKNESDNAKVSFQGNKNRKFRVRGMDQLGSKYYKNIEISKGKLVFKAGDVYLHITFFYNSNDKQLTTIQKKTKELAKFKKQGYDIGLKDTLISSLGYKIKFDRINLEDKYKPIQSLLNKAHYRESKHFKKKNGYPKMVKKKKFKVSNNYIKKRHKLQKIRQHETNKKSDRENKLVAIINAFVKHNIFEDLNIKAWQKLWGKCLHDYRIGGVVRKFEKRSSIDFIDRFEPSSKRCNKCGSINKTLALDDREWECKKCGHFHDRDINASYNIEDVGSGIKWDNISTTNPNPRYLESNSLDKKYNNNVVNILVHYLNKIVPYIKARKV